ncbi:type II/IV secretion system ATPase subunit [Candidatus Woesearchaeota archaeon]|nr:type II/IV secretion system ATPase subunit [Candidatus Woesearchaeota archaeon]
MTIQKRGEGFFKDFKVEKEGADNVLYINYEKVPRVPSIEDDALCMAKTCELLQTNPSVTKIVFTQKHDYQYDYDQIKLLQELVKIQKNLIQNKEIFSYQNLNNLSGEDAKYELTRRYNETHNLIFNQLLKDPIGTYIELTRILRREKIELDKEFDQKFYVARKNYISLLNYLLKTIENTHLIQIAIPYTAGYKIGSREIYRKIFMPDIKPDFMFTKIMATYPKDAEEVMNYNIGDTEVIIFKIPDNIQYLYHITPPEFKLSEEKYEVLDLARKILSEHQPEEQDFVNPERMREVFQNVGSDLLQELITSKKIKITQQELNELTKILIRYTVGFGLIEVLLEDEYVQDITVNSPTGETPIFLVHGKFNECKTNIIPSINDAESWASKLRLLSGRPLDEANPILDTDIEIPNVAKARVGVISKPLNPTGIAYAFRRHRDKPWTLTLFIKNKMITPLAAGLMSFLIDGNRTMLVAGTRSAGKSSLLGAVMVEIMRKYRIITIEDTLELPGTQLRKLEYNIQSMKVASALSSGTSEVSADAGIRTTLRLGDSALIVGEVRSTEAQALYEAMRVGALANVVAGTIHGDSPYGVYDRVVNDLKVPKTSFKATDLIIVANPIRSADGLHKWRRVTQITEVRKDWEDDPLREKGFVDLMRYNSKKDELEPTDELLNGDSELLKAIAGNVKDWAGNWDAIWDNIQLRANIKELIVKTAEKENKLELLEAPFNISANDQYHRISDKIKSETGILDSKKIYSEFKEWLKTQLKRINSEEKEN